MAGDVTIPAETARDIAAYLRGRAPGLPSFGAGWVDLLDQKPVSLRDEVAAAAVSALVDAHRLPEWMQAPALGRDMRPLGALVAPAVLAVVKARIEALPDVLGDDVRASLLLRRDVLALFGDES
jgi:hypothetical protein